MDDLYFWDDDYSFFWSNVFAVRCSWLDRQKSLERDNEGEDNSKKMSGRPIATGSWFYCSKVFVDKQP